MEVKEKIKKYEKEDFIDKLYCNDLYLAEKSFTNKRYRQITQKTCEASNFILNNLEGTMKEEFLEYLEQINEKEGIEAKEQFKLGFKTAIKLIMDGLN